jgi:hypothetical protein
MTDEEAFSMVGIVCEGQRRSGRVVKGSPEEDCEGELLLPLPPLRELTKFCTSAETSFDGAALLHS